MDIQKKLMTMNSVKKYESGYEEKLESANKITVLRALLFLFIFFLFVQIELFRVAERSLNVYHVMSMLFCAAFVFLIFQSKSIYIKKITAVSFVFLFTLVIPAILSWELTPNIILLFFAFCYFLMGVYFSKVTPEVRIRWYSLIAAGFILAIFIRDIIHFNSLAAIYSRSRDCDTCFLATGGRNIEATMFSVIALLYRGKYKITLGILLSVSVFLFESRIGIIGAIMYWGAYVLSMKKLFRLIIIMAGVFIVIIAGYLHAYTLLERFSLSDELILLQHGVGRLALWSNAIKAIPENPLGIGPGVSVNFINSHFQMAFWENNIHNSFLSWILELGWFHGGVIVVMLLFLLFRRYTDLPEIWAVRYVLLSSLFQFTGYDAVIWFFLGVLFGSRTLQLQKNEMSRVIS
ncbi:MULTISPECIES: O-antigen ligase family protein [Enterobacteriaceae]|uniref:O-antigen ligase family protein n=1 Tax=Enterobacteriaceae TaxID=543 RepID=UPI00073DABF5|nr:O-antigen ligase family protein [Entomohabitans teleogrylli]EHQ8971434.1 O-antigen ligase family protein [Escherichia coli]